MSEEPLLKAAAYVRMSTEHQQYSTDNQLDTIHAYAARRGFEIVQVYSDAGKSGLSIQGRDSLAELIGAISTGQLKIKAILVYDVSRWGRFQDADESAYHEYVCKQAGVAVHYCAEQFENDGSPVSTIVKGVKRAMAGEYSRELSSKVFQGACRLVQLGFRQGGIAGYGLRRMLVDQAGTPKGLLNMGEHKSIQTDRVILVPGPQEEIAIVKEIYSAFIDEGKSETRIAEELNQRGLKTDVGRNWTRSTVHGVLTNEKYLGNNVYHRTSTKLKTRQIRNPEDMWIRSEGCFEKIIDEHQFFTARGIILGRCRMLTDAEMLDKLRQALQRRGKLSGFIIDEFEDVPSSSAFRHRFGSLISAYRLIGYDPKTDYAFIEINRAIRRMHPDVVAQISNRLREMGTAVFIDESTDIIHLSGELTVSLVIGRCHSTEAGNLRWSVRLDTSLRPDVTIVARLNLKNDSIRDYYLLPGIDMTWEKLQMAEDNGISLDAYRFPSLDYFYQLARRTQIEVAA